MASPGLRDFVLYLGKADSVQEYFQAADIFVSASHREGFPNVLIEAMATGLTPVVVEIPDIHAHIIAHGVNGLIVTQRVPEAFAATIVTAVDDAKLMKSIAQSALETVTRQYSIKAVAGRYLDLYNDLGQFTVTDKEGARSLPA